jgi:hypothetical protein
MFRHLQRSNSFAMDPLLHTIVVGVVTNLLTDVLKSAGSKLVDGWRGAKRNAQLMGEIPNELPASSASLREELDRSIDLASLFPTADVAKGERALMAAIDESEYRSALAGWFEATSPNDVSAADKRLLAVFERALAAAGEDAAVVDRALRAFLPALEHLVWSNPVLRGWKLGLGQRAIWQQLGELTSELLDRLPVGTPRTVGGADGELRALPKSTARISLAPDRARKGRPRRGEEDGAGRTAAETDETGSVEHGGYERGIRVRPSRLTGRGRGDNLPDQRKPG